MKKVAHILSRKGNAVISVSPQSTVLAVLQLMADKNIGSVVVMDNNQYKGVITERDYARKIILLGKTSGETNAAEIMSTGLPRVTPDSSIEACMHIMSDNNIRYLPVFDNTDAICGIISILDVVTEAIHSQKETIDLLHSYIQTS
ncbi:MAG: CBS domain-containing protein [Bacteroidetes bacterium]|nr:CBS domain-containing protein [Bacteroidota bacterium]MBS1670358.1 CBS domain-containing protein [Bacteroidota bacterium]